MNILEIAKQAGCKEGETWCKGYYTFTKDQLKAFSDLIKAEYEKTMPSSAVTLSYVIKEQTRKIAELEHCVENRAKQWAEQHIKIAGLEAKLAIAIDALEKLSKLGNEPFVGNSIGNSIAVEALTNIKGE